MGGSTAFTLVNYRMAADPQNADWVGLQQGTGSFRQLGGDGGIYATSIDATAPLSVVVVCANSTQAEVHLFHVMPAEVSHFTTACGTPPVPYSDELREAFTYLDVPDGGCGNTAVGADVALSCGALGWVVPGSSYDEITLANFQTPQDSSLPLIAPTEVIVNRRVPATTSTQVMDFSASVPTTPHEGMFSSDVSAPQVFWLTNTGAMANVLPLSLAQSGGRVLFATVPESVQQANDVHLFYDLEDLASSTSTASSEIYAFMASPGDVALPAPSTIMAVPTVQDMGTAPAVQLAYTWTPLLEAVGYVLVATELSNTTPRWTSFVSPGYLQGSSSYLQPDLTGAPGFSPAWQLQPGIQWSVSAILGNAAPSDLIGSAYVLPSFPGTLSVFHPGPTTDGLQFEVPTQIGPP